MNTRAMITFDVQKEDRYYHFLIPNGSPYQEAKDALAEVIGLIDEQEKASKEAKPDVQEAAPTEVAPEIVA